MPTGTKAELESAIEEIWETAQNADASRAALLEALDSIQELCVEAVPDVEDRVTGFEDADGDGIADDDENSDGE